MAQCKRRLLILMLIFSVGGIESKAQPHFETLFPDSPYRRVYRFCIDMWHTVRDVQNKEMHDEQWRQFNYTMIDSLVNLHNHVGTMLENQKSCSPDDIEHLMGVLHVMHVEYISVQRKKLNDEVVCGAVLFNRIKNKLEKVLSSTTI
jgi:hypothetical protein